MQNYSIKIAAGGFDVFNSVDVSIGPLTVIEGGSSTGKSRLLHILMTAYDAINQRERREKEGIEYAEKKLTEAVYASGNLLCEYDTREKVKNIAWKIGIGNLKITDEEIAAINISRDVLDRIVEDGLLVSPESYAEFTMKSAGIGLSGYFNMSGFSGDKSTGKTFSISDGELEHSLLFSQGLIREPIVIDCGFIKDLHSPQIIMPALGDRKGLKMAGKEIRAILRFYNEDNPYFNMSRHSDNASEALEILCERFGVQFYTVTDERNYFILRSNIFSRDKNNLREGVGASRMSDTEAFISLVECLISGHVINDEVMIIIDTPEAFADDEAVESALEALWLVSADKGCNIVVFTRRHYKLPDGVVRAVAFKSESGAITIKEETNNG